MTEEQKKKKCNCCLILGIVVLALGLLADYIGLSHNKIFGPYQIAVIVTGAVLLLVGLKGSGLCCCRPKQ